MLFIVTMIGLTFVTVKLIGKNTEIKQLVEKLKAEKIEQARSDSNVTEEDSNLKDA